jgi:hypothetical protein
MPELSRKLSGSDPVGCNSRLVGFIKIETAAGPASRGLADDDASLGQVLVRLAGQSSRMALVRGGSLKDTRRTGSRMTVTQTPMLSADLTMLAQDLERTFVQARRAAALQLAG